VRRGTGRRRRWAGSLDGPCGENKKRKKKKKERGEVGWAEKRERVGSLFFFQIIFQTNFKPFKFKSFTCFQTQILTQIYSSILRLFRKTF
jgi:hypothetical protein